MNLLRHFIRIILAAMVSLPLISCREREVPEETELLLRQLDTAVERHPARVAAKADSLRRLRFAFNASPGAERYEAFKRMRHEYLTFDLDSAIHYGELEHKEAIKTGDRALMAGSAFSLARLKVSRGQVQDAFPLIVPYVNDTVTNSVRDSYNRVMADMEIASGRVPIKWYRKMLRNFNPDDEGRWFYELKLLEGTGHYREADSLLNVSAPGPGVSTRERAIYRYLQGELSLMRGDTAGAVTHLAQSSLYDLSVPVRDYQSLYRLSTLLLRTGDPERAYRYIKLAVTDADASKVAANRMDVNSMLPDILNEYERHVRLSRYKEELAFAGIGILSAFLLLALIYVMRQKNRLHIISENEKLLNARLQQSNNSLQKLNGRLEESNKVKDAYLLQYLRLSSDFVREVEQLKLGISSAFHKKGLEGVNKFLADIDDRKETKRFHSNFDATFLALYPGFVTKVNDMLKPECRLGSARDGSLSTELRVLALIRLGITDSESIAAFLHKSLSTIYNCRVRIRNSAIYDKEEFTKRLLEIS